MTAYDTMLTCESLKIRISIKVKVINLLEWKLRGVLRGVKSKHPQKRYEALNHLHQYQQMEGTEVQIDVLKDFVKTAAGKFSAPVAGWDNPSYHLINYVCDFQIKEVAEALVKHFDTLDLKAKERAIDYLLSTDDEDIFLFLEEKILKLMDNVYFQLPANALSHYPYLTERIIRRAVAYLNSDHLKFPLYELILVFNRSGYGGVLEKEQILPLLLEDYIEEKNEYFQYDVDYSTKFVYTAWKDNYLVIRNRMILYISLMEFYFSSEVEKEILEVLTFNDPLLKTQALAVCLTKHLPFDEETILTCASDIESADKLYWTLVYKDLVHLYPSSINVLTQVAKSRMFYAILVQSEDGKGSVMFPENLVIVDKLDVENDYGQHGFYYLFTFENNARTYTGWSGIFSEENGEEQVNQTNASYTEFVEFSARTIDEHKQDFLRKDDEQAQEYNETTFYESTPKIRPIAWFLLVLLVMRGIRVLSENGRNLSVMIVFTLIVGAFFAYELMTNKRNKVLVTGQEIIKRKGASEQRIAFGAITKVSFDHKHVLIYTGQDELVMKIPKRWMNYELFCYYINEQTAFFTNRPYIQSP